MIDNGYRARLTIPGVFDGEAGVQGRFVAFAPYRPTTRASSVRSGTLDGKPVRLTAVKDDNAPFWTFRFEVEAA